MITELRTDTELERQIACDWLCEYGTEEDWNRLLDAHSGDQQVRRRFGLWLLEQGQAKGEGYLALAACGRDCMHSVGLDPLDCPYWFSTQYDLGRRRYHLPQDWSGNLRVEGSEGYNYPLWANRTDATRLELEEAAAEAFLLLPPQRREQLLRGEL